MKHHPWVAKRVPQTISTARASVTKAGIQLWFRKVREYFGKWQGGLAALNDPRHTINMDESGFPLDGKTGRVKVVLAPRGLKNVYQTRHGSQEQITVVGCTNALGDFMKPYILYPQQRLRDVNYTKFREAIYSGSETGWMTREHFMDWITHFDAFLTKQRYSVQ